MLILLHRKIRACLVNWREEIVALACCTAIYQILMQPENAFSVRS